MWRHLSNVLDRIYVYAGYGAGILLVGLCGMILYSILGRLLGLYLGGVNDFAGYVMATSTFMALSYTFRTGGHIRVALLLNGLTGTRRRVLETFCLGIMSTVICYLAFYMCRLVWFSYDFQERSEGADATLLWMPQTPVAIGAVLFAVAVVHQLIETLVDYDRVNPETSSNEGGERGMTETLAILIFVGSLFTLLALGVWVGAALLTTAAIGLALFTTRPIGDSMALTIWGEQSSWTLTALPLFIWMGEILFRTKLSETLFRGLAPFMRKLPGGLLHVNVGASAVFAAISGSSAATVATVGKMSIPELRSRNYPEHMIIGTLSGAGTLGLLIPPSIAMIVFGVTVNESISKLFMAAMIPGLVLALCFMAYVIVWSLLNRKTFNPIVDVDTSNMGRRLMDLLPVLATYCGCDRGRFIPALPPRPRLRH